MSGFNSKNKIGFIKNYKQQVVHFFSTHLKLRRLKSIIISCNYVYLYNLKFRNHVYRFCYLKQKIQKFKIGVEI